MPTPAEIARWRDSLIQSRLSGVRELRDSNGETVRYGTDAEMAKAIAAAERCLAARIQPQSDSKPRKVFEMKNFVQPGVNLTLPAPAIVLSGDGLLIGSIFGIAAGDAASGADVDLVTAGVFTMPKVSALAIGVGDVVYFDSATKLVSKTSSGNSKIGVAVTAAANPSATVAVKLIPAI